MNFSGVFEEITTQAEVIKKKERYDREFDTIGAQIKEAYKMGHTTISISPTTSKTARNALAGAGCIVKPMTNNTVLVSYEIKLPQI